MTQLQTSDFTLALPHPTLFCPIQKYGEASLKLFTVQLLKQNNSNMLCATVQNVNIPDKSNRKTFGH